MSLLPTKQQREQVLQAIDKIEAEMLLEEQRVEMDLRYDAMKFSGELQRLEQERAFREELRWS